MAVGTALGAQLLNVSRAVSPEPMQELAVPASEEIKLALTPIPLVRPSSSVCVPFTRSPVPSARPML